MIAPASLNRCRGQIRLVTSRMWSSSRSKTWPFSPLDPSMKEIHKKKKLRGVVFDVDGTLCLPQNYMFREMRDALGIPKTIDILDHIESLNGTEQEEAHEKVRVIERRAMQAQTAQPGLVPLMEYLDKRTIPKAICTRNFEEPVNHLLSTFLPGQRFSPVITRSFKPPKPDPAGILHIADTWGVFTNGKAADIIMVGDSVDDMLAGSRAGAVTVLLVQDEVNKHVTGHEATDFCISRLEEMIDVLETGVLKQTLQNNDRE